MVLLYTAARDCELRNSAVVRQIVLTCCRWMVMTHTVSCLENLPAKTPCEAYLQMSWGDAKNTQKMQSRQGNRHSSPDSTLQQLKLRQHPSSEHPIFTTNMPQMRSVEMRQSRHQWKHGFIISFICCYSMSRIALSRRFGAVS